MLKRFFHALGATACLSLLSFANAQSTFDSSKLGSIKEFRDAGNFELRADGTLVPRLSPLGTNENEIVWFESVAAVGSFFNIGNTVDPSPFNLTEYVSHADGLTVDGAVITGFTLYYATDMSSGSLDVAVTYYDDGVADPAQPSPAVAALSLIGLPIKDPADPPGAFGFVVNVTIPPELQFALTSNEFQYGLRRTGGTGLFGPLLQPNIPGQVPGGADSTVNATVGTTYNFWESWTPPGQDGGSPNDGGDGSGDNTWWFGGTGPWAGARYRVFAVGDAVGGSIADASVYHSNFSGLGSKVDSGKDVHVADGTPTELTYDNLINSSGGISGILVQFDTVDVGALDVSDFDVKISPTGDFTTAPQDWDAGPVPTITANTIPEFLGSPDHALLEFAAGTIVNRWVRVEYVPTGQTMYLGHLLGEATGPAGSPSIYTVNFSDISVIRAGIGQTVGSDSIIDIDKNGTTTFSDISAMRGNIGAQLSNITVE